MAGLVLLGFCSFTAGRAQSSASSAGMLPEDPALLLQAQRGAITAPAAAGRISGTVIDINGGLVPGAQITLASPTTPQPVQATADSNGYFSVPGLPPGTYSITIASAGLQTFVVHDIRLKPGDSYVLPRLGLPIARTAADVTVSLTEEQVAETQLHTELQQRVFGVFPNFYSSFEWDAAPLTIRQKLKLSTRSLIDPVAFATTAAVAGAEQIHNTFPEYGSGGPGYARRYGAAYGDFVISHTMGSVLFASLFHQDPRYFVMGTGTTRQRTWHALSSSFMQRGDNRHWQPAYSLVLGNAATGALASTYHPGTSAGQLILNDTLIGLGGRAVDNLVREFLLRGLTHNVPSYAKGKPLEEK